LKLQAAAEKAKKTLSPNGVSEVAVNVECLADDQDLSVILTKSEFEMRSARLIDRLQEPVINCLRDAGLTAVDLSDVEIVGGTSRISIVKRRLGEILKLNKDAVNYGLKTTMNSDEAVARGGALQCAMLSAQMRVKPFNVVDVVPFCYVVNGTGAGDDEQGRSLLFNTGEKFPLEKITRWTLGNKTRDFVLSVDYKNVDGVEKNVSKFTIKLPATSPKNVRVSFNLDKNYLLVLEKAEIVEESLAENVRGETDKKKKKYTNLIVITETFGLDRVQITKAITMEKFMATADNHIIETADKRNELETYLYSMRCDICIYEYAHTYTYTYTYIHVCLHMYIYIFIYIV
jgi:heat shock protein 4